MTVYEILNNIQTKLKVPKNQYNKFGEYNYRSCEDILEAVKPLLSGSIITINDEVVNIGNRFYIKAIITITYDGESISCSAFAREDENQKGMSVSQVTGSTSSYARKYSANGLFLIDDTKDADTMDNTQKQQPSAPKTQKTNNEMSSKQWTFIKSIGMKNHELTEDEIVDMVKWKADEQNLPPRHWKMSKLLLPEENFEQVLSEYSEHKMNEAQTDDTPY